METTDILRVIAWCILAIFRFCSVFNRICYNLLEWVCELADTRLQGYLTGQESTATTSDSHREKGQNQLLHKFEKSKPKKLLVPGAQHCGAAPNEQVAGTSQRTITNKKKFQKNDYQNDFPSTSRISSNNSDDSLSEDFNASVTRHQDVDKRSFTDKDHKTIHENTLEDIYNEALPQRNTLQEGPSEFHPEKQIPGERHKFKMLRQKFVRFSDKDSIKYIDESCVNEESNVNEESSVNEESRVNEERNVNEESSLNESTEASDSSSTGATSLPFKSKTITTNQCNENFKFESSPSNFEWRQAYQSETYKHSVRKALKELYRLANTYPREYEELRQITQDPHYVDNSAHSEDSSADPYNQEAAPVLQNLGNAFCRAEDENTDTTPEHINRCRIEQGTRENDYSCTGIQRGIFAETHSGSSPPKKKGKRKKKKKSSKKPEGSVHMAEDNKESLEPDFPQSKIGSRDSDAFVEENGKQGKGQNTSLRRDTICYTGSGSNFGTSDINKSSTSASSSYIEFEDKIDKAFETEEFQRFFQNHALRVLGREEGDALISALDEIERSSMQAVLETEAYKAEGELTEAAIGEAGPEDFIYGDSGEKSEESSEKVSPRKDKKKSNLKKAGNRQ